jgi:hypothetical protein
VLATQKEPETIPVSLDRVVSLDREVNPDRVVWLPELKGAGHSASAWKEEWYNWIHITLGIQTHRTH